MEEYYKKCKYVCLSQARGFRSKEPVPTCRRFHYNTNDDGLRGTFEKCCDVAIDGRCIIPGAQKYEQNKIDLFIEEYKKRKQLMKDIHEDNIS